MGAALSLPGTGRGDHAQRGGRGGSPADSKGDCRQHAINVLVDLIVPEPQDAKSVASELSVAGGIVCAAVLTAIDLDDEMMLKANEVENVAAVRTLPPEMVAMRAPRSKVNPKLHPMFGHRASQPTRTFVSQPSLLATPPTMLRMVPPPRAGEGLEPAAALVAQHVHNAETSPC